MLNIAIDGPSGAGKSTLAKKVAEKLGFLYVDTGACYRGLAYYLLKQGVDINNGAEVSARLDKVELKIKHTQNGQRIIINDEDVTDFIRTPEVSEASSVVSAIPAVRGWLLGVQRDIAGNNNVIMDGRDIGTVVLPDAQIKLFLTASPEQRAHRRHQEYLAKGEKIEYNDILRDLIKRDQRDSNREIAPLKQAEGCVLLDSTDLNFEQTLELILNTIDEWKIKNVV